MVDRDTAIQLGNRSDSYRAEGIAKDVDRNDKRSELLVGGLELSHDFRDCRCEHGRGQGTITIGSATSTRWNRL